MISHIWKLPAAAACLIAAGCWGSGPLAGTYWQLVEVQSGRDTVLRPEDPSKFTMLLAEDGTVRMQLDCNQANGTWSAEPGSSRKSGSFEFGRLAATRALCPPPNLDELIARDFGYVRSYELRGDMLYLSLPADGSVYVWEEAEQE